MQQKVSPVMIVIGVILVVGIAFAAYKMSFAPRPNNVSKDNIPAYAKGSDGGLKPGYGSGQNYGGNGYAKPPGQ